MNRKMSNDAGSRLVDLVYFRGILNTTVRLSISDRGGVGRACFRVYSPDGVPLDGGRCANSSGEYLLLQNGPYTVLLTDQYSDQSVQFTLSLGCISGRCRNLATPAVEGCISQNGTALARKRVVVRRPNEPPQRTRTDVRGCYAFDRISTAQGFSVSIKRPAARRGREVE